MSFPNCLKTTSSFGLRKQFNIIHIVESCACTGLSSLFLVPGSLLLNVKLYRMPSRVYANVCIKAYASVCKWVCFVFWWQWLCNSVRILILMIAWFQISSGDMPSWSLLELIYENIFLIGGWLLILLIYCWNITYQHF